MSIDHGFETRSKFHRLASAARRIHDLYEEIDRLEKEETALSDELGPIAVAAGVKVGDILDTGDALLRLLDKDVFELVTTTRLYALDFPAPDQPLDADITEAAAHAAIEDTIPSRDEAMLTAARNYRTRAHDFGGDQPCTCFDPVEIPDCPRHAAS